MKKRTKILISILAGFIVLLGCGVWLFQSLRSEPAPTGEEAAPLTNLTAMLNAHDTIVTAQYQESSDPYTTDGGESWQVDSTYTRTGKFARGLAAGGHFHLFGTSIL